MRAAAILLSGLLYATLTGCGSVGEPLYPALKIPTRVSDLAAVERGDQIDVTFTNPSKTTEGLTLTAIGKIDLRVGPNAGTGFDLRKWLETAEQMEITGASKPGFVLKQIPALPFVGKDEIIAVRVSSEKGRFSDWSNLVTVTVEQPLATPTNVTAKSAPEGAEVDWDAVSGANLYRVYRKTEDQQTPATLGSTDQTSYLDTGAEFGKTYQYYIEATHEKTVSIVAGPMSITPKDTFPPKVPTGLNASAGVGAVELAWDRNTEADFKEYRIFRAEGDGAFAQIADALDAPIYSDRTVESGKRYRYQVVAVDQLGNASQPSTPVEVTVP
jgi:hypothetical protein